MLRGLAVFSLNHLCSVDKNKLALLGEFHAPHFLLLVSIFPPVHCLFTIASQEVSKPSKLNSGSPLVLPFPPHLFCWFQRSSGFYVNLIISLSITTVIGMLSGFWLH